MIIKKENENQIIRKFIATKEGVELPVSSTKYSAGYDIKTTEEIVLKPNEEITYDTNLIYQTTEPNDFVSIYPRSGLGFKYYCRLANTVGIIDADYEGTIKMKVRNEGNKEMTIPANTGIAQIIIQQYLTLVPDNRLEDKREGGFGSTDKK